MAAASAIEELATANPTWGHAAAEMVRTLPLVKFYRICGPVGGDLYVGPVGSLGFRG